MSPPPCPRVSIYVRRVRQDRYSEKQAAKLVKEVLRTVAVCHSKGVLMRDIKPHNVSQLAPARPPAV